MKIYILLYQFVGENEYHNTYVTEDISEIEWRVKNYMRHTDYKKYKLEVWKNGNFVRNFNGDEISKFIERELKNKRTREFIQCVAELSSVGIEYL